MTIRLATVGVGVALLATVAWAQQPRDTTGPAERGTASIGGVVVSADAARTPIRRAVVVVSGSPLTRARSAISDDSGRFVVGDLPVGRFTVVARKAAYLDSPYGSAGPGRPGTAVQTAAGERRDVTIEMPRGAVIAGMVRDLGGEPASGLTVRALDMRNPADPQVYGDTDGIVTDDRGQYRIYGLPPGQYTVVAVPRAIGSGILGQPSEREVDDLLTRLRARGAAAAPGRTSQDMTPIDLGPRPPAVTLVPVYYPGTPMLASSGRIALAVAEVRTGIDLQVLPIPAATIAGTVIDPTAPEQGGVQLSITLEGQPPSLGRGNFGSNPILSDAPGPDGRFQYTNVAPGRYTIVARARHSNGLPVADTTSLGQGMGRGGGGIMTASGPGAGRGAPLAPGDEYLYAREEVMVNGADVSGLSMTLRSGATVSGRVVFENAVEPPIPMMDVVIRVGPPSGTSYSIANGTIMGNTFSATGAVHANEDGTFEVRSIAPDRYQLTATQPQGETGDWWLRSAEVDGRDLLDAPFDIGVDDVRGVVLTYTDRQTVLTGRLQSAAGTPAPDFYVVVVPADRARWVPGSRRMQAVRPDTDGVFRIPRLPGGDYLLAALTDFEPADLSDLTFLDQLTAAALPVTVEDGTETRQDLQLGN